MHGNERTEHGRGIRAAEDRAREILDFVHDVVGTPLAVGQRIAVPRPIADDDGTELEVGTVTGLRSAPVTHSSGGSETLRIVDYRTENGVYHSEFASRVAVIR
ncbi:hypothetical protein ACFRQM_24730 [Streptomyces sp. NPDC056831]|uniref:hypothetical protein n=1 Tax=Streptomyces sp. NPDC056831 TaxID=3345954 RepID=UPI0036C45E6A